jgi:hypothetical protein
MEHWKPVPGFEADYEVSDTGRVKRTSRGPHTRPGLERKPGYCRGYARFTLSSNGQRRIISAHKLVWEAFRGPVPEGMHINHINGVKDDNRLENLELATPSENMVHACHVLGYDAARNLPKQTAGENNGRAKLREADVLEIRRLRAAGEASYSEIMSRYSISSGLVSMIVNRKVWGHI